MSCRPRRMDGHAIDLVYLYELEEVYPAWFGRARALMAQLERIRAKVFYTVAKRTTCDGSGWEFVFQIVECVHSG